MKINDVLDCVNSAIEGERVVKELAIKGHFIAITKVDKAIGPYKEATINIIYVDLVNKVNIPFVTSVTTERALVDHMNSFIENAEKQALVKFIFLCHEGDNWEKIVEGKLWN